jgi:CRP-like cAMP-binding protein
MNVKGGTTLFDEGDPGDPYDAVSSGSLEITRERQRVQTVSRGQGFGEIALIRDVPRRASVTALTAASLYSLRKDVFVQAVTGHPAFAVTVGRIVAGRLGESDDSAAAGLE